MTSTAGPTEVRHLIAGERVGDPTIERHNPAHPGDVVALTPTATEQTVADAVGAASDAFGAWSSMLPTARGSILSDAADILIRRHEAVATDMVREEGKTLKDAMGEVRRAIDVLRYFGGEGWRPHGSVVPSAFPDTMVYTKREPLGVVAAITPWNFPIAIPAWKIAPALVSGNTVVLKPAELTPMSVSHLAAALTEAGLPDGVLNVVFGSGSTTGAALTADDRVRAVSFTGSVGVGRRIAEAVNARGARVQLEMGGKNPLVVLDDADLDRAVTLASIGAFGQTGQVCTATSRIICEPGIHDQLVERLVEAAGRFPAGDGLDPATVMGPVVSQDQLAQDRDFLTVAEKEGAQVLAGGDEPEGLRQSAAVVTGVEPHHRIAQEEVFGPVAAVLRADDFDDALRIANGTDYGLAAGVVTRDISKAHRFIDRIEAGVVKVNRPTNGLDLTVPFGGVKSSSTNTFREQGFSATDFYTSTKSVYLGTD
jgi:acyl-CoA reductase-like NAD-dependent aldehyde dehydrogenase